MTSRINRIFKESNKKLVTFTTAGDPDIQTSIKIIEKILKNKCDIIEIGMPFSDPMADGPAIQASSLRAIKNGMTLVETLKIASEFRQRHPDVPLFLMGYYNPIYIYGNDLFITDAVSAGVDGLIIVDLPPEEDDELCLPAKKAGLNFVRLVTPTSDDKRLPAILAEASGFVYYVSVLGITGTKSAAANSISNAYQYIRKHTNLPIVAGFGIRTPEQAAKVAQLTDGAVVGSAVVDIIAKNLTDMSENSKKSDIVQKVLIFASIEAGAPL